MATMALTLVPWIVAGASTAAWARSLLRRQPARAACGEGAHPPRGKGWEAASYAFRVGTYNIHRGKGTDGRRDLSRIASHLAEADLVALQETGRPSLPYCSGDVQQLARLLDCGWLFLPGQNRLGSDCYGNGLLTRRPVLRWYREPLVDRSHNKLRSLTVAHVPLPDGRTCAVLITHISKRGDQHDQLRRVLETFRRYDVAVLLGDFNATRENTMLRDLVDSGDAQDAIATAMGDSDAADRIDWILTRGLTIHGGGTAPKGASDHPYYWADLQVPLRPQPRYDDETRLAVPHAAPVA